MKRLKVIFLFLIFCVPVLAAGESKDNAKQLRKAADVVNQVMATPEKSIPRDLLARAVCVGIIPSELKFAFGFGGNYGRGVLVCRRGGNGPWGAPSFFTVGGGSFGFQIGGKSTDVVFIVMNPDGARKLVQDSVKLGAEVSAAAGPVCRSIAERRRRQARRGRQPEALRSQGHGKADSDRRHGARAGRSAGS